MEEHSGTHQVLDEGLVITVLGAVSPERLGIALTHEHLFVNLEEYFSPDPDPLIAAELEGPLHLGNLGHLRRSLGNSRHDLALDDERIATYEATRFAARGGGTICDVSSIGIRVPEHGPRLQRVANATGLHIVAGTGVYVKAFHPKWIARATENELADLFVNELNEGIDGSDVRAGLIGEVGLGRRPEADEEKVLTAAGIAHLRTGAAIVIHQVEPTYTVAHWALDHLQHIGVGLERVVIGHSLLCADLDAVEAAMRRGAYVAFDTIGIIAEMRGVDLPSDIECVRRIVTLAERGVSNRLLLSQDVSHKRSLRTYGGCGYDQHRVNNRTQVTSGRPRC